MKEPSIDFLLHVATALRDTEHKEMAGHFSAGFLYALYPEWFDKHWPSICASRELENAIKREYESSFGAPVRTESEGEVKR